MNSYLSSQAASQLLTQFFNIGVHQKNPINFPLCSQLSEIDPVIWNRLAKTNKYNRYKQSFNIIQCNEKDEIHIMIDVSRVKSIAEAVKKENKLFPAEVDRYRPLGFNIKYRVG